MGRSAIDVPPAGTVRRGANRSANLCEARTVRKVRWEPEANAKDCFRSKQEPHMAARAYWQGQIRLALVSIAVEVYSATKSGAQFSFGQIPEQSGKPLKYEKVVTGIGPATPDEILKGFEYGTGDYVLPDTEATGRAHV